MTMIAGKIARELGVRPGQVEKTIALIDEGNTIPFIARYRKEVHGGLDDEQLRKLEERLIYLRNLEARKEEVLRLIDEQGKLTEALREEINQAEVLQRVEDLYRPYKQKKSTRASKARERGLEPLAEAIRLSAFKGSLVEEAARFVDPEKDVNTPEDALAGARDILAEQVSDDPAHRQWIKEELFAKAVLASSGEPSETPTVYDGYLEYSERIATLPNHRILAVNRGEKEGVLKVRLEYDAQALTRRLIRKEVGKGNEEAVRQHEAAVEDAFKRLIAPSIEREIRNLLTERAEEDAIVVFGRNTRPLLMQPPVKGACVLGVDPSYRTGCKLAVVDAMGKFLAQSTIYPNKPQMQVEPSRQVVIDLIKKYHVDLIAIGNGTASRETEQFIAQTLSSIDREVAYTIVSEAGASVYSASELATKEFPDINVSIRGAISIARRLQDPLAELVKIDPKSIGVGQYQHDVNQKRLGETLGRVVEDCVNQVGVDVNTASVALLSYVAGISESIAKNIVEYRENTRPFSKRSELLKVKRLGDKAFQQCAGFLRVPEGADPLDHTGVHPESYPAARELLTMLGYGMEDITFRRLETLDEKVKDRWKPVSEALGVGVPTLKDIVRELQKPGRDPREEMPSPVFRKDVMSFEDLTVGMILPGTVRNVVNFGAFVDIGVKNDGLVHISELSDRYVKDPMEVVKVGDTVTVKIIKLDAVRQKIGLSMKGLAKDSRPKA